MATTERRIIVLGKIGNGKSSTANSLLGQNVFKTDCSLRSVTQYCQKQERKRYVCAKNVNFIVVDTPGLLDTEVNPTERMDQIKRSIDICPEPHAFLLVFNPDCFMTEDEEFTISLLPLIFGENLLNHCIVLFTHGDSFENEQKFTESLGKSNMLSRLVNRCGGRIARIENDSNGNKTPDMSSLYEKLEIVCKSGRKMYKAIDSYALYQPVSNEIQWTSAKERRIILIGKIGNGKSSTGNSLLGRYAFDEDVSLCSVTQISSMGKRFDKKRNMTYIVADTPGLMDTEADLATRLLEIQESVNTSICPNPHAFLLVFSSNNRITDDEKYTIDQLRVAFGDKVFDHCIVVFTNGGKFKTDNKFEKVWKKSPIISQLAERCGGRIIRIENKDLTNILDNKHVKGVYDQIELMSECGKKMYRYKYLEKHTEALKLHKGEFRGARKLDIELSLLTHAIGKKIGNPKIWSAILVGGSIVAVGVGGVGIASTAAVTTVVASGVARAAIVSGATAVAGVASALLAKFKFW